MRLFLTCALAACLSAPAWDAQATQPPQVYILAGQSNMSGRGLLEELTPEERTPADDLLVYGNDAMLRVAREPLDDAAGQIDAVSSDARAAVGPGLFFARRTHARTGRPIVLVPCAKGGSSIGRWAPGKGRHTLYGSCLARAREFGAPVSGVLWYQGETDAEKVDAAARWRTDFEGLVAAFRKDLGADRLPVVLVQLADAPAPKVGVSAYPSWSAIQAVQAGPMPPCVGLATAVGLSKTPDDLHLDTAGQRQLGLRLAEAMASLDRQGCR